MHQELTTWCPFLQLFKCVRFGNFSFIKVALQVVSEGSFANASKNTRTFFFFISFLFSERYFSQFAFIFLDLYWWMMQGTGLLLLPLLINPYDRQLGTHFLTICLLPVARSYRQCHISSVFSWRLLFMQSPFSSTVLCVFFVFFYWRCC